ncbi:MAG: hypothetical protein HY904_25755 [Deltaproteobacteria bacterium]|nr:hypothetical protein [Deltaproteobacteria bacterium]
MSVFEAQGIQFNPPPEFGVDEVMLTLKGAPVAGLKDPRMLQKQTPVRPNLIIHRRVVGSAATVEMLCGEVCAELVSAVDGIKGLGTQAFAFDDGGRGMLVVFDFPAGTLATVRQFQALRLDAGVLTSLTLTVDSTTLNDTLRELYLRSLASMKPPAPASRPGFLNT